MIKVAAKERGYHIFYFLLRGAPIETLKPLYLTNDKNDRLKWEDFNYLKTGGDLPVDHDVEGWNEVLKTMKALKFNE